MKVITRFYRNYHSMRFVHDKLVIRLRHVPSESALQALNEDFAEIMVGEKICVCNPLSRRARGQPTSGSPAHLF